MAFWIARNKNGDLYLYYDEPEKRDDYFSTIETYNGKTFLGARHKPKSKIPNNLFPEVTFENSPQQVEFKLIK